MSAEIHVGGLISPVAEGLDLADGPDRVLHTAGDRPDADTLPALADPAADHCDQAVSRRRGDVQEKHARIAGFLDATGNEAVLLGRADSVAWFTSGLICVRRVSPRSLATSTLLRALTRIVEFLRADTIMLMSRDGYSSFSVASNAAW